MGVEYRIDQLGYLVARTAAVRSLSMIGGFCDGGYKDDVGGYRCRQWNPFERSRYIYVRQT